MTTELPKPIRGAFINKQGGVTLCQDGKESSYAMFAGYLYSADALLAAGASQPTAQGLPELPEAPIIGTSRYGSIFRGHSDEAMRAYAIKAISMAAQPAAQVVTDELIDRIADDYEDECGRIRVDKVFEFARAILSLPPAEQEPVAFDYKQAIGSKNCMQCSVAYMLGLPVDSVPDFEEQSQRGIPAYDSMECFIESQGFGLVMLPGTSQPECDYLASGKTKRGTSHMVVMNSGHLVHDPHPSDDGLDAVSCIWLITRKAGCTTQTTNHAPTPHPR